MRMEQINLYIEIYLFSPLCTDESNKAIRLMSDFEYVLKIECCYRPINSMVKSKAF